MTEDFTTKIDVGFGELCQAPPVQGHIVGEQQQQMSVLHAMLGDPTLGSPPTRPISLS